MRADLLDNLLDKADMLRAEGLDDIAVLLEEAAAAILCKEGRTDMSVPVYIDLTKAKA
jgi:hypothetical protein